MRKYAGLVILALMLPAIGPWAYADDDVNFNDQLRDVQSHRLLIEAQLGIKAHEYNYDVADHYLGDHMMHQVPEDVDVLVS